MAIPHFILNEKVDGTVGAKLELTVSKDVHEHLFTARIKAGERFILVDAPGHGWEMQLLDGVDKKRPLISVSLCGEIVTERSADLTLIQGISAGDRMDQTIRQVTELGVTRIIPLESERSTVKLDERS
ncbi:MAG TPA: hypothetical protein DEB24_06085, partial [Coriobacteriia bacterium]|nr:hypothetical protein [Coriobacteriia bacterium]